ncbi:hypothetical protein CEXT_321671 [Caerostris extrusa]|uniref:Uncharacterized protein n=1 Tax=Caerostris extrusa TaxID=172846 RepID=A0AAV4XXN4_CAEEX|nr:hypothetical protein CEXT_321671 [Caerostris extrusa]
MPFLSSQEFDWWMLYSEESIRCFPPRETEISLNNRVSQGNGALQVKMRSSWLSSGGCKKPAWGLYCFLDRRVS